MREPLDALRSLKRYVYEILGEPWEVRLVDEDGTFERPFAIVHATGDEATSGDRGTPLLIQPFQVICYCAPQETPPQGLAGAAKIKDALWRGFKIGIGLLAVPSPPVATIIEDGGLGEATQWATYQVTARNRYGETTPSAPIEVTITAGQMVRLTWPRVPGAAAYRVYRGDAEVVELLGETTRPELTDVGNMLADLPNPPLRNRARAGHPNRVPLYDYDGIPIEPTLASPEPERGPSDYMQVRDYGATADRDNDDPTLWTVTASVRLGWRRSAEVPSDFQTVEAVTSRPA